MICAYSGDFGIGLFGHLQLSAAYLLWEGQAWQCYLCNIQDNSTPSEGRARGGSDSAWATFSFAAADGADSAQLYLEGLWRRAWHAARCQWDARLCQHGFSSHPAGGSTQHAVQPVVVVPVDAVRQRLYVEPIGIFFTVQGGTVQKLSFGDGLLQLHLQKHEASFNASSLTVSWAYCASSRPLGLQLRVLTASHVHVVRTDRC